ncbi:hypothetical protein Tco_1142852 [Tanacetum coccineum]
MKSIIKEHNKRNKANPIRLNFEMEDQDPKEDRIVKGREVDDNDLSKPFKETLKTPFTRRIIEFSGPEYSMQPAIAHCNDGSTTRIHLNRFVVASELGGMTHARKANGNLNGIQGKRNRRAVFIMGVPKFMKISSFMDSIVRKAEEAYGLRINRAKESHEHSIVDYTFRRSRDVHQRLTFPSARRDDRDGRNNSGKDFRKGDYSNSYKGRDNFNTGRQRDYGAPYPQRERTNRPVPVLSLDSLTKCPKEILATETQLHLPPPRPVANPLRTGRTRIKYCDLITRTRDNPQMTRVERRQNRNPPVQKVINMVSVHSSKKKKRKDREATESWMNTPISFPSIMTDERDDETTVKKQCLRILVKAGLCDEGTSVEVMFEHCFREPSGEGEG